MKDKINVLICANPDLNFIDGSSIWSQTITLIMAAAGNVKVDFLAKSKPERETLFHPLKENENITIINGTEKKYWEGKSYRRLTLPMMADLAVRLDRNASYDLIIVRGFEIATSLLKHPSVLAKCWMYLTDIPQIIECYSESQRQVICDIAEGSAQLLFQSEGFKNLWQELVPGLDDSKVKLYTPVVPDLPKQLTPITERPLRAIYAGKFKGDWMTLEMAENWHEINKQLPDSELVMIGDKIHNEPDRPKYHSQMSRALQNTVGLTWLGAQSREAVQFHLQSARVGLSWRDESMNDTVEYSTKILEYGAAGCAAILNRNSLHEQLLGKNYPLFANSSEEFRKQLIRALMEPKITEQAAQSLKVLAEHHTFSRRVAEVRQWVAELSQNKSKRVRKTRVLVAGHDLKFFALLQKKLEDTGRFEFFIDQWQGHNKHNESKSRALLEKADIIFCEWCLGNLVWYSKNKKVSQRLVARFHLQERDLPYVGQANWENIDYICYVSEFIRREGQKAFGFPYEKTKVIPNLLDEKKFTANKKTDDARYTLGLIGAVPARKRLDRAIDLLEELLKKDDRYCLRVKGKHPLDYDWLHSREDEIDYYRNIFTRINSSARLRHKVIFDPPGDNVNEWLTMIGFILSPSDFESFHMAIGEGMLTGCIPLIWSWDGAPEIWNADFVRSNSRELLELIDDIEHSSIEKLELRQQVINSEGVTLLWEEVLK